MEYFRIIEEDVRSGVIYPRFPMASAIWKEDGPLLLWGQAESRRKDVVFLPFYQATILSGAFLISRETGDLWKQYQTGGRYRPCVLYHEKTRKVQACYLMYPRLLDVLHRDTEYLRNGEIQTIYLIKNRLGYHKVFGIKGAHTTSMVVAGDVLDHMLRKGISGFKAKILDVKEEM